jgi:hypothetical protein
MGSRQYKGPRNRVDCIEVSISLGRFATLDPLHFVLGISMRPHIDHDKHAHHGFVGPVVVSEQKAAQRRCRSIGQTFSKVFASHHMAIELAIDAIGQRAGALILRSALISGSRQCGLASRFTSLACSRSLTTGRAALASQCALLCWCQFSFRFRFHDFPSF